MWSIRVVLQLMDALLRAVDVKLMDSIYRMMGCACVLHCPAFLCYNLIDDPNTMIVIGTMVPRPYTLLYASNVSRQTLVEPKTHFWDPYVLDRGYIPFRHHLRGYNFTSDFTIYLTPVLQLWEVHGKQRFLLFWGQLLITKTYPDIILCGSKVGVFQNPPLCILGEYYFWKNLGNWSVIGALLRPVNWK
jgi:hypothetical protein